ncbi:hypothetical protein [Streptomyces mirabilis]|uniref:hypothetical protein n=1 Tax=Streptomyces mirabilis TaxID=68239 RepID=UPI003692EC8B
MILPEAQRNTDCTEFRVSLFPAHSELELASAERELARTLYQGTAMLGIGTPERL